MPKMKRKREVKPQLSAFAARKQAAELEALRQSVLPSEAVLEELQSEGHGSDSLSQDESDSVEPGANSYSVLQRTMNGGDVVHTSRSQQVADAEAEASFRPKIQPQADGQFLLGLAMDEVVSIQGFCSIQIRHGILELYGARLEAGDAIHSLSTMKNGSLPSLRAIGDEVIAQEHFPTDIVTLVVINCRNRPELRQVLERYPIGRSCLPPLLETPQLSPVTSRTIVLDESWHDLITNLDTGITMLVGPKSVGKSTLARHLLNKAITDEGEHRCFYIDLDPGQPEFSPPGLLTAYEIATPAFGSSMFEALREPLRQHWIGEPSPKEDPSHYLACVHDLCEAVRQVRLESIPVIVNTPGWIKGTGLDLLLTTTNFLDAAFPGEVALIDVGGRSGIASLLPPHIRVSACDAYRPASEPTTPPASATDVRNLNLISYFHRRDRNSWHGSLPIPMQDAEERSDTSCLEVDIRGNDALYVQFSRETIAAKDRVAALNGTVVGIVSIHPSDLPEPGPEYLESRSSTRTTTIIPALERDAPLDPRLSHCLGLALVAGIDLPGGKVRLITPVGIDALEASDDAGRVIVLVTGSIETPAALLLSQMATAATSSKQVPYVTTRPGTGHGWQNWHVRRNIGRRVRNS